MGVALKPKFPWIAAYSDKLRFFWDECSTLRVIMACMISLSLSFFGKLGSHNVITVQMWFLKLHTALSKVFLRCV